MRSHGFLSSFKYQPSIAVPLLSTAGISGWHLYWPLPLSHQPPDVSRLKRQSSLMKSSWNSLRSYYAEHVIRAILLTHLFFTPTLLATHYYYPGFTGEENQM